MARNVAGFYHDPPIFLTEHPIRSDGQAEFSRFHVEALVKDLSGGLKFRATVEGLFAFDFSDFPYCMHTDYEIPTANSFEEAATAIVHRTYIMNAYLAFFYTRQRMIDGTGQGRMVVTPELTIPMDKLTGNTSQGFGAPRVSHLAMSGFSSTYIPGVSHSIDSRIGMRIGKVSKEVVGSAADDLSETIERHGTEGIVLVDLFLRASKAFEDHNHNLSLINYWAIIERLLNDLWMRMQDDFESHGSTNFIDSARKRRLSDGRTFSASVMSEMLSFLDYISKDLYDDISSVRKARNDWMHSLKSVDSKYSSLANSVCERLLRQVMNITIIGSTGRRIHS